MLIEDENEKRKIYSCGNYELNGFGRSINKFTELKSSFFEHGDVIDFSVGENHTLILISNRTIIGFGNNEWRQLGTKKKYFYQTKPIRIKLHKLTFNISDYHLSCGFQNSFIYYIPSPFSNLEEDLIKIFRRKEFCDISFKTINPNEKIEAHKLILKYRLKDQNQIEKLQEIISKKSIKESNQIFEMIYSNNSKVNPKLYPEIKEIINLNEKLKNQ
ncbi:ankyrin repeat-containing protein [Anaeramoeba ignava]|uniref:Ankyrin repeat-containing protein n=1 Tax=Anaeramoeba ignava TaxID=1746090 RepID=A0A9Q0LGC7_ANAIG|nr:ankyrin repeat-containing protein [Anaeramoeba ignava]